MIRIDRITLREIQLPLVDPFRTAAGVITARRIVLLEIADGDGVTAWSECVAQELPTYAPETVDTAWLATAEWLAPRVLGTPFAAPAELHAVLAHGVRGHQMARAGIEMGAWALAATRDGVALAALLARHSVIARERGTAPRATVATGIALGAQATATALAERARAAHAAGYARIKVKIAPEHDVAPVAAVRAALGPDARIMADANSSYSLDQPAHVAALEALDSFALTMIEQPLAHDDLRRHAMLQRRLATPLCLDESITSVRSVEDMLALGSGRVVNLKAGRVGGLREAVAIHDLCGTSGVALWCGGMLESGIGRAYNVALASLPGFTEPGDLSPSARYWARDVVTPEWTMDHTGQVRVPLDRTGIGVEVDVDRIDDLTTRTLALRA